MSVLLKFRLSYCHIFIFTAARLRNLFLKKSCIQTFCFSFQVSECNITLLLQTNLQWRMQISAGTCPQVYVTYNSLSTCHNMVKEGSPLLFVLSFVQLALRYFNLKIKLFFFWKSIRRATREKSCKKYNKKRKKENSSVFK